MDIDLLIESDLDARQVYLLPRLASRWRTMGHQITVRKLSDRPRAADVGVLHVDRSVICPDRLGSHTRAHPVINGRALDITKRRISTLLCGPDDDYNGPIIIKTNLNYWGLPEQNRDRWKASVLQRLRQRLPWRISRMLPPGNYPILPKLARVPNWVWQAPELVVERFVPERDGALFVTRYWVFLGEREFVFRKWTRDYLVKRGDAVHYEFSDHVPQALRERRQALGFDFGKFDWVVNDSTPILLDANKTPSLHSFMKRYPHTLGQLVPGIEDFVG